MNIRARIGFGLACLVSAGPALAEGNVNFDLASPQDGARVAPGARIEWTITVRDSSDDNLGLALACVDLVQDPNNPELLDLAPALGAPPGMEGFDRPWGVSNPGLAGSAYGGTPSGPAGKRNLTQIGGAQNTLGFALGSIGLDADVDKGVGQGDGGQVIATGSFTIPSTPGVYTFSILWPRANVLSRVNAAPEPSVVEWANARVGSKVIRITVECGADFNSDGERDLFDFLAFVDAFNAGDTAADCDANAELDMFDFLCFVNAFNGGC